MYDKFYKNNLLYLLPICYLSFLVTAAIPLEIYSYNYGEFDVDSLYLIKSAFSPFFIMFFLTSIPYLFPFKKLHQFYFYFLVSLSLIAWVDSTFLLGDYGVDDGRGFNFDFSSVFSILQLVVASLIILLMIFSSLVRKNAYKIVLLALIISVIVFALNVSVLLSNLNPNSKQSSQDFRNELLRFSSKKNVLHIVLDELPSNITQSFLEKNINYNDYLDGFTFYTNTLADYPTTIMAIPALISGEVYNGKIEKEKYVKDVFDNNRFFSALNNKNFSVELHTIREYCKNSKVINCSPISAGNAGFDYLKLIDLSLFRLVPDISKPLIFNNGAWLLSSYFKEDISFDSHNIFGNYLFDKFNNSISVVDNYGPTYKFFHSLLTHSPMVLGPDCSFRENNELQLFDKMNMQAYCGFNHILNLFNKLKKLKIYDETMIVLSSDHGSTYSSDKLSNEFLKENINPLHHSMSLATLMIKPFHSRGKLKKSSVPVSLHDIPKTILDEMSIYNKLQGKNIFKLSKSDKRERIYYFYDWTKENKSEKKLPPFKIYNVTGDVNNIESWSGFE